MLSSHFHFKPRHLALLAAVAGACLWAQDDSPITITDGSLTMHSLTPWTRYGNPNSSTKVHPDTGRSVTQVVFDLNRTIPFNNQQCTVTFTYSGTVVTVTTGANGKGLRVSATPDFSAFQRGASDNHLVHRVTNAKISHVTIKRGTQTIIDQDASGGTSIKISYHQ